MKDEKAVQPLLGSAKKPVKTARYQPYRRSMILDKVHPKDLRELKLIYACEDCSYFAPKAKKCAMGFRIENHLRENQHKLYNLTGRMAICRAQEID